MKSNTKEVIMRFWKNIICIICGIGIIAFPQFVPGEKPPKEEVIELERIVVTAPGWEEEAVMVTPSATVINVEKYKKPGMVQTVRDLLMEVGGIDIERTSIVPHPGELIFLRGLDESRFLVAIDGRPANQYGAYGTYLVDWTSLPIDGIERIEIIRGGHSALYPTAEAGVINIITKKGKKTKELKPKFTAETSLAEYGTENYTGSITGGIANVFGYSISGGRRLGDGYLRNNWLRSFDVIGRFSFFLPNKGTFTFGWQRNEYKMGYPVVNDPSRTDYDPAYPIVPEGMEKVRHLPRQYYPGGDNYWYHKLDYQDIVFTQPLGPGTLRIHGYKNRGDRELYWYEYAKGKLRQTSAPFYERVMGGIAEYQDIKFDLFCPHRLTTGIDYRSLGSKDNHDAIILGSAYLQDSFEVTPKLTVTTGLRFYYIEKDRSLSASEQGMEWYPGWIFRYQKEKRDSETQWCPKLRLDYKLTPSFSLYGAISRAYRVPTP